MSIRTLLFVAFIPFSTYSQQARVVKIDDVIKLLETKSEKIQVVNFWATWCAPCIKELPHFEKLNEEKSSQVKVTLISMDLDLDPNPDKVYKFIDRKQIKSEVLMLDEKDPNTWIDKISEEWSGSLPATLVFNSKTGKRKFVEKELSESDLQQLISEVQ